MVEGAGFSDLHGGLTPSPPGPLSAFRGIQGVISHMKVEGSSE